MLWILSGSGYLNMLVKIVLVVLSGQDLAVAATLAGQSFIVCYEMTTFLEISLSGLVSAS